MEYFTHHAYLTTEEPIFEFAVLPFTIRRLVTVTLAIDQARELKAEAYRRPESGKVGKLFLLQFEKITKEAAQALLKILEDPPTVTHFFLITKDVINLPETLRSRLMVWDAQNKGIKENLDLKLVQEFLKANSEQRLALAPKLTEDFRTSLDGLESEISRQFKGRARAKALALIIEMRKFLSEPAMLPRLCFEHLALTLPN